MLRMSQVEAKTKCRKQLLERHAPRPATVEPQAPAETDISRVNSVARPLRIIGSLLITVATVALAVVLGTRMWRTYFETPWTRDATVRAYVVTMAPEVAGRIVELRVADNQFVHKGEELMVIDPTDYRIAVARTEAVLQQAQFDAQNVAREAQRRQGLAKFDAVPLEQLQLYQSNALVARAKILQATAELHEARVDLERTRIRSPVDGWVTNLLAQLDDFAAVGQSEVSLVDSDSFWIDAYFEENQLVSIHDGDAVKIKLMGYRQAVRGHVASISRGINVSNAQPNQEGLATVNPIFTWVRLAQRIPVRIHIDQVPQGVRLVAGMTATVQVEPSPGPSRKR